MRSNRSKSPRRPATSVEQPGRYRKGAATPSTPLVPLVLVAGFALTGLVPQFDGVDVMGAQWLYLSILNLLTFGWLWRNGVGLPTAIYQNLLFGAFAALLVIALASFTVALNPVESLVTYSRLLTTFLAVWGLVQVVRTAPSMVPAAIGLLAAVAVLEAVLLLYDLAGIWNTHVSLDQLILGLRGNAGNKNIIAAALAVKWPFVLLQTCSGGVLRRASGWLGGFLVLIALLLLNARAAYLSAGFIALGMAAWPLFAHRGRPLRTRIGPAASLFLLVVSAIGLSQMLIGTVGSGKAKGTYGAATERLADIAISNEGSSGRLVLWRNAIDHIGHHPLLGGGYGNWKIHSIPYERYDLPGFGVRKHAHNDFLQMTADTGLAGGLAYLLIFVGAALIVIRRLRASDPITPQALMAWSVALAWGAFAIDALFNFPTERAGIQAVFAFLVALPLVWMGEAKDHHRHPSRILTVIALMLGVGVCWVNYNGYRAMAAQSTVASDWFRQTSDELVKLNVDPDELARAFPAFPDLGELAMPIDLIKAKYYCEQKRYDEALPLIASGRTRNPYIGYDHFLLAMMAHEQGDHERAWTHADSAVALRPANQQLQRLQHVIATALRDTVRLRHAFLRYVRNDSIPADMKGPSLYREHALGLLGLLPEGQGQERVRAVINEGLARHPDEPSLLFLLSIVDGDERFRAGQHAEALVHYQRALPLARSNGADGEAFHRITLQNIARSAMLAGNYAAARPPLDELLKVAPTAALHYDRGVCAARLGDVATACSDFRKAAAQGHAVDATLMAQCPA